MFKLVRTVMTKLFDGSHGGRLALGPDKHCDSEHNPGSNAFGTTSQQLIEAEISLGFQSANRVLNNFVRA